LKLFSPRDVLHTDQQIKIKIAQFDKKLLETVAELEAEKSELELEVQHAKARIAELKSRQALEKNAEDQQLAQLHVAVEVQRATNDALEAEIQATEQALFRSCGSATTGPISGGETGPVASDWPEIGL
jgi:predicted RNase H-like nuclease (RuvC/YqgF family)